MGSRGRVGDSKGSGASLFMLEEGAALPLFGDLRFAAEEGPPPGVRTLLRDQWDGQVK